MISFLGLFFVYKNTQIKKINSVIRNIPLSLPQNSEKKSPTNASIKTTLEINGVDYKDEIAAEISVYDFMSKLKNEGKINFTEKYYAVMGELIISINGIKNNNNQSWIYYVNGVEAQVGVSNYKIKYGDTVSWKYEKSIN